MELGLASGTVCSKPSKARAASSLQRTTKHKCTGSVAHTDMFTQFEQLKNLLELPVQLASPDSTASSSPIRHSFTPSSSDLLLLLAVLFLRCGRVDPHRSRTHTSPSISGRWKVSEKPCVQGKSNKTFGAVETRMRERAQLVMAKFWPGTLSPILCPSVLTGQNRDAASGSGAPWMRQTCSHFFSKTRRN